MENPQLTRSSLWLARRDPTTDRSVLQLSANLAKEDFERCLSDPIETVERLPISRCGACRGAGINHEALESIYGTWVREILHERLTVDETLDQAPVPADQVLNDTAFILERLSFEESFIFLGDDDYHSLVLAKFAPWLEITVLEADSRIVVSLNELAKQQQLNVNAHLYDAKTPLPEMMSGQHDAFFTDPPYSPYGVHLFAHRGLEALKDKLGVWGLMALPMTVMPAGVRLMLRDFQEYILRNGYVIVDTLPAYKLSPHPKGIVSGLLRFERVLEAFYPLPEFKSNSLYEHFY